MTDNQRIAEKLGWKYEGGWWTSPEGTSTVSISPPDFSAPENLHLLFELVEKALKEGEALQITIEHGNEYREVKIWPSREDAVQIVTGGVDLSKALITAILEATHE